MLFYTFIKNLMDRKQKILYSVLSGLILIPAWYQSCNGLILLFAFVPLLYVEYELYKTNNKTNEWFWLPFLSFFIWNIGTTWWLKNASIAGFIAASTANTFFMTIPFWLFTITHRKFGNKPGYLSLIIYWLAFEYFYLNAEISWTWLNLGNGFAKNIRLIQWYEYTGTLGGTLWIISVNISLFCLLRARKFKEKISRLRLKIFLVSGLIILPILFSFIRFYTYKETGKEVNVVVVQPNIDPYEKFISYPVELQLEIFFRISDSLSDEKTDYIVAPETFINNRIWLNRLGENNSIQSLKAYSQKYPHAKLVIGITAYKEYNTKEESPTARPYRGGKFYDSFNAAIQIDTTDIVQDYFKSQLVVAVEKMPYAQYLSFLKKLTIKLGGTTRSHGTQNFRESFNSPQDSIKIGPVICYESIFGEYVSEYISECGSNLIFIITNDGWWGNTPGYIQHKSFSSLRAIENRRSIARSANTGISALINQKGESISTLGWWVRSGLKGTLLANDKTTFYTRNGDYLGRIAGFFSIALLLYTLTSFFIKKK